MNREFFSDTFASCRNYLGKEVTEIDTIKQSINSALISDSGSEFSDTYLRTQYNSILTSMNQKRDNIVNHQIYLGKRKSYIGSDDISNANKMNAIFEDSRSVITNIEAFAKDVKDSVSQLANGNISLSAIISEAEIDAANDINTQLGEITYDDFCSMSVEERNQYINNAMELVNQYIETGVLTIPENGRIELPIAPGITLYCSGKFNTTLSDDSIAVDYDPASRETCLHIMGGDEFKGLDASIDTTFQTQATYTQQIDDNTSIYVATGYNMMEQSYFIEKGVNISSDSVTLESASVNVTATAACGVQIYEPSNWKYEPDFVRPVICYQYEPIVILPFMPFPSLSGLGEAASVFETVQYLAPAF